METRTISTISKGLEISDQNLICSRLPDSRRTVERVPSYALTLPSKTSDQIVLLVLNLVGTPCHVWPPGLHSTVCNTMGLQTSEMEATQAPLLLRLNFMS
jgi:hypothetical protein